MTVSLVISTYNRPDALQLCLLSVFAQTRLPDEIIIGDDGSADATRLVIGQMRRLSPVPLIHVWQKDSGFRLARMRNQAVAVSLGDYIIEIDGDLIISRHFVADHLALAMRGHYLKGGRCNLGKELSDRLCREGKLPSIHLWTGGIEAKRENLLHSLPLARWLAPRYRRHKSAALGCNMSFFREDYYAINGYDETFEGWGGEDWDFGRRMQRAGISKRSLKFAGGVCHLWHADKYMYNKEENLRRCSTPIESLAARCGAGVDAYTPLLGRIDRDAPVVIFPEDDWQAPETGN